MISIQQKRYTGEFKMKATNCRIRFGRSLWSAIGYQRQVANNDREIPRLYSSVERNPSNFKTQRRRVTSVRQMSMDINVRFSLVVYAFTFERSFPEKENQQWLVLSALRFRIIELPKLAPLRRPATFPHDLRFFPDLAG